MLTKRRLKRKESKLSVENDAETFRFPASLVAKLLAAV
jgi:hypothetical protein